jgi:hypothetical protein
MMDREVLKDRAFDFLESLEEKLTNELRAPAEMRQYIHGMVAKAKNDATLKHMRQAENAFLYAYAVPIVLRHMRSVPGIGDREVRQSFLSEFFRNFPDQCSNTPARTQLHPFSKVVGINADIFAQWRGQRGASLRQACPDFAFQQPFPFKIVFEGKYFQEGGIGAARNELVSNIYQTFFYRALPYVAPKKSSPAWDYDFACLLACDASEKGN